MLSTSIWRGYQGIRGRLLSNCVRRLDRLYPGGEEVIGSRVPAFRYNDKPLVSIGASKRHLSLFIKYGAELEIYKDELKAFDISNTVIQFTTDKPIPKRLVIRLVKARVAEIEDVSLNQRRLRRRLYKRQRR
jgi:uncharacterized protein YdhG (YjbR/CyaY superfamily)